MTEITPTYLTIQLRDGLRNLATSIEDGIVTPWMVPLQESVPPGPNIAAILVPPCAADGPTPVMAFRASVESEK